MALWEEVWKVFSKPHHMISTTADQALLESGDSQPRCSYLGSTAIYRDWTSIHSQPTRLRGPAPPYDFCPVCSPAPFFGSSATIILPCNVSSPQNGHPAGDDVAIKCKNADRPRMALRARSTTVQTLADRWLQAGVHSLATTEQSGTATTKYCPKLNDSRQKRKDPLHKSPHDQHNLQSFSVTGHFRYSRTSSGP
jgi:hypothetical protein